MVGLGVIGFIDDFLKTRNQRSLGLGGWSKIAGMVIVAAGFAALALNFPNANGLTPASSMISFIRDISLAGSRRLRRDRRRHPVRSLGDASSSSRSAMR